MTYHDRSELAPYSQPSAEHLRFIFSVIKRASNIWTAGAPRAEGGEFAEDLVRRMQWKKQGVIESAFEFLKNSHETNFFPKPVKWQSALDHAQKYYKEAQVLADCDVLEYVNFRGKMRPLWEKTVLELIDVVAGMDLGKMAKKEGWWGCIFENGHMPSFGLANYLKEVFTHQIFILNVWPQRPREPFCVGVIDEMIYTPRENDFRGWLNSHEFKDAVRRNGIVDVKICRKDDLAFLRQEGKKRAAQTQIWLSKNPGMELQIGRI